MATPSGYYDGFNPLTKAWKQLLSKPSVAIQSQELNSMQTVAQNRVKLLADAFFTDGSFIDGGVPTVVTGPAVSITAGTLYALSDFHQVPAATVTITGNGTEIIYLIISQQIVTAAGGNGTVADSSLYDPAEGAENFGQPGMDRLQYTYEYVLGGGSGIPIVTLIDGQIVTQQSNNGFLNQLLAILAQRTYEQSGSFLTTRPNMTPKDIGAISTNPAQFTLQVQGGVCYDQGYRFANNQTLNLSVLRPLTGQAVIGEPNTFLSGTLVYSTANSPVLSFQSILATVQSPTISMSRGLVVNGSDSIPTNYQPVEGVVSCSQTISGTTTTFVQGTDFNRSGNLIQWLSGGNQPATGSSYNLVVDYNLTLAKAVRTLTTIANEAHTVASSGTTNLSHGDVATLSSIVNTTTSTTLNLGTDFTLNTGTGAITWINRPATGQSIDANYTYWAHTVEGDYVARDSFVDSAGNIQYNSTPTKTPTGVTVNYTSQISFDVIGGHVPVVGFNFDQDYNYTLGRTDVVAWGSDGVISIIPGVPALSPAAPSVDSSYTPIAKLNLPPEATAETVTIENYNNVSLPVTSLCSMNQEIQDLQYDIGVFQLQQSAANQPTSTTKRGIFADNFSTPLYADLGASYFAGTFDFLAYSFRLPRIGGSASPTISSSTNATLCNNFWLLNYGQVKSVSQPYRSTAQVINQYGAVNQRATTSVNPSLAVEASSNLTVIANAHNEGFTPGNVFEVSTTNSMLLTEVSQFGAAAQSLGISSSGAVPSVISNNVPVDSSWLSSNSTTTSSQNVSSADGWATVMTYLNVTTGTPLPPTTFNVTGSNFLPHDRAINCLLDGVPIALTATGSTVQETLSAYPGTVQADNEGNFTASFVSPSGLSSGTHILSFAAHSATELSTITSLSSTNFITGGVSEQVTEVVTLSPIAFVVSLFYCAYIPAAELCGVLGFNPDQNTLVSTSQPAAYTFAYAIAAAAEYGIAITQDLLAAAIEIAFGCTYLINYASQAQGIASVCTLGSTNVAANAAAMMAAYPVTQIPLGPQSRCLLDPLAQTFTPGADGFATSVDLYFNTIPTSQVTVALATTDNGIPTTNYLTTSTLQPSAINTTGATNFAFNSPIYVTGGTEYAFVVMTSDNTVSLWTAVLGQTDTNLDQLILNNPSSGTLLQSSNGSTWEPLLGKDLQFNVYVANFTETSGVLNLGQITFAQSSSIIALWMPFSLPSSDTTVQYQYSVDNTNWVDFAPLVEQDLGAAYASIYLRILLTGSSTLSPVVFNAAGLQYFIWESSGCYTHRYFDTPIADVRYVDIYCNCDEPGNTSLTFWVSFDEGTTWNQATEQTADAVDIDGTFYQRHFLYDGGSAAAFGSIKTKCVMSSTVNYITPTIEDYIVIGRST